jgi:hypothetical protein
VRPFLRLFLHLGELRFWVKFLSETCQFGAAELILELGAVAGDENGNRQNLEKQFEILTWRLLQGFFCE